MEGLKRETSKLEFLSSLNEFFNFWDEGSG